jgi:hypothetical protein
MSIFSKVRNAKKAAEDHKRQSLQVEQAKPAPYKHVPTHAAQDALTSAPTSWSVEESRAKIHAAHKRRSTISRTNSEATMATMASGQNFSMPFNQVPISRTLSEASLPSMMAKPRPYGSSRSVYSFSGVPPVPSVPVRFSNSQLSYYGNGTASVASSRPTSIMAHRRKSPLSASEEGTTIVSKLKGNRTDMTKRTRTGSRRTEPS